MGHKHHIIPKHEGGTNNPSNLIEVTVEEHAIIHYNRWMIYGTWEDELAYKGLAGLMNREDRAREASRRANTGDRNPMRRLPASKEKQRQACARWWEVTFPDGHIEVIKNINEFSRKYGLDGGVMSKVGRGLPSRLQHKGFQCRKLP